MLPPLAGAACYLALVGAAWAWMAFNSIVTLRQRVRRAWANIEVELTRRAELLLQNRRLFEELLAIAVGCRQLARCCLKRVSNC